MNKKYNDFSYIFTIISIILLASLLAYVIYMTISSNNIMNLNDSTETLDTSNYKENLDNVSNEPIYMEKELSSYTSTLYDNENSRIYNINLACEKLNGTIIPSNSEFSFNGTIGPMNAEQGYKKATGFDSNGKLIKIYGGGMCQVSSTLYNAALLANLEITERHAHSRRVSYVPEGKDATIYYPDLDLKFLNNTDSDIQIQAYTDNYSVTIKLIKIEKKT